MRLIPLTSPDYTSLLPAASGHCRIDPTTPAEDASISALLAAAVDFVEGETRQQLFTRRYELYLDGFPTNKEITLPKPPLLAVDFVTYTKDGTDESLPEAQFIPDPAGSMPGSVTFKGELPQLDDMPGNLVIEFRAGYGDTPDTIPPMLKQAILLTFGHWYANREAATDRRTDELPLAVRSILNLNTYPEAV